MIGLTIAAYHRLTDALKPELRSYAMDLLTWTWSNRAPLPPHDVTLMRIARCASMTRWRAAWAVLSGTDGLFRHTENGYVCDGQIEKQQVCALKSAAGKASARARQQRVEQRVDHGADILPRYRPVENSVENPLTPVENRAWLVENAPPVPPLSTVRTVRTQDQVKIERPGAGAPFSLPENISIIGLPAEAQIALGAMLIVLRKPVTFLTHEEFRAKVYMAIADRMALTADVDAIVKFAWSLDFWKTRPELVVRPKDVSLHPDVYR